MKNQKHKSKHKPKYSSKPNKRFRPYLYEKKKLQIFTEAQEFLLNRRGKTSKEVSAELNGVCSPRCIRMARNGRYHHLLRLTQVIKYETQASQPTSN